MGPRRPHSVDRLSSRDGAPPPTQVFTRGRTGLVKTKPQSDASRRSTSVGPSSCSHSRTSSRKPTKSSRYPPSTAGNHGKRQINSHISVESSMSYAMSSDITEDHSIHSAPSPGRRRKGDFPERREPTSSRPSPPTVTKHHHHQHHHQLINKRDLSPDRSIDIQKQHVRTTRKIVEGKKGPTLHVGACCCAFLVNLRLTCACLPELPCRNEPGQCGIAKDCRCYQCL